MFLRSTMLRLRDRREASRDSSRGSAYANRQEEGEGHSCPGPPPPPPPPRDGKGGPFGDRRQAGASERRCPDDSRRGRGPSRSPAAQPWKPDPKYQGSARPRTLEEIEPAGRHRWVAIQA